MAGSLNHCLTEQGTYRGHQLLENMGDMREAVEEMVFIILYVKNNKNYDVEEASDMYFSCLRGERPWPSFMMPGMGERA